MSNRYEHFLVLFLPLVTKPVGRRGRSLELGCGAVDSSPWSLFAVQMSSWVWKVLRCFLAEGLVITSGTKRNIFIWKALREVGQGSRRPGKKRHWVRGRGHIGSRERFEGLTWLFCLSEFQVQEIKHLKLYSMILKEKMHKEKFLTTAWSQRIHGQRMPNSDLKVCIVFETVLTFNAVHH